MLSSELLMRSVLAMMILRPILLALMISSVILLFECLILPSCLDDLVSLLSGLVELLVYEHSGASEHALARELTKSRLLWFWLLVLGFDQLTSFTEVKGLGSFRFDRLLGFLDHN